ncbi:MAG: hypothetical protein II954_07575 [Synergistaceae bacterium]|nr:hypothetical protein [Synergistaceae bacterium]
MQRAYMSALMELAEKDKNILHLIADSGTGFDEMFRRNFPGQMYNFGISEQLMTGAAAGMAIAGKIPFVFTYGSFLVHRAFEFIRNDICFQNISVKMAGMGCGLSVSTLGPSHHTTEDISVLRSLPNLTLLSPATPAQTAESVRTAYETPGPVYVRIGMNNEREFFGESYTPSISGLDEVITGREVVVFSTGSILAEAYEAVNLLRESGVDAGLVNVWRLKPFDSGAFLEAVKGAGLVVSVEEHSIHGGLGGILSEVIAEKGGPRLRRIGLADKFAAGYGTLERVRAENGLDAKSIYESITEAMR